MKRRFGKFYLNRQMVENLEVAHKVMARCVILRAEQMFISDSIEYFAYSSDFKEISVGEIAPEYSVVVDYDPDADEVIVRFEAKQ